MPGGFLALYGWYGPSMRTSCTLLAQMCAFVAKNADDMNRQLAFFLRQGETVLDVLAATDDTNCSEVHVFITAMMDYLHIQILNRSGFWGTYGNPPPTPCSSAKSRNGVVLDGVPGKRPVCVVGVCAPRITTTQPTTTCGDEITSATPKFNLLPGA